MNAAPECLSVKLNAMQILHGQFCLQGSACSGLFKFPCLLANHATCRLCFHQGRSLDNYSIISRKHYTEEVVSASIVAVFSHKEQTLIVRGSLIGIPAHGGQRDDAILQRTQQTFSLHFIEALAICHEVGTPAAYGHWTIAPVEA